MILTSCEIENFSKIIKVGLNEAELGILVDFLYTGNIYLSVANIDSYLKISTELGGISKIKEKMLKFLTESASEDNYFSVIALAEKYGQNDLKMKILNEVMKQVQG